MLIRGKKYYIFGTSTEFLYFMTHEAQLLNRKEQ